MPSDLSEKEFAALCKLSALKLSKEEFEEKKASCTQLLNYVEMLQDIDVSDIQATFQIDPDDSALFRADEIEPSLSLDEVLKNAPESAESFFVVPQVIGDKT